MTVCSPAAFSSQIQPWLMSLEDGGVGSGALMDSYALADRDYFLRHCKSRPDSDLFELIEQLLAKKKAPQDPGTAALEPAAIRIIGSMARGRCLELGTGSGGGTLALLKGAMSVVSIDHQQRFTTLARETIKDPRVEFMTCPLDPATGFYNLSTITGKFDCIVVDGPLGTAARRNSIVSVLPLLAPGGFILEDDAIRDSANIKPAVAKAGLHLEMLATKRGLAKIQFPAPKKAPRG